MGHAPILKVAESKEYMKLNTVLILTTAITLCLASPTYTGYSGAPGSGGACAGNCHGVGGGTITVSGFPMTYSPGQAYTIRVSRASGSQIANFNASVRVGTGSQNAGTIEAGTSTAVYNVSGETNGVHFASPNHDTGNFIWTAPSPGVGEVRLYLSGLQGTSSGGQNTEIMLTAQAAGVNESRRRTRIASAFAVEPTVARTTLLLRATGLSHAAAVRVINGSGRCVERFSIRPGDVALAWPLSGRDGRRLPAGVYHAILTTGGTTLARRFVIAQN